MNGDPHLHDLCAQLDAAIEAAWPSGWQPVDIVRIVAEVSGAGTEAVVCAGLGRTVGRHPRATVAPTWIEQLAGLGIDPWPAAGSTEPTVPPPAAPEPGQLAAALRGLRLMAHFPAQPMLCDPPGRHRPGTAARSPSDREAGLLAKVRALLAKAESTTFPAEAEALTAKAQELISRHAIDEALCHADEGSTPIGAAAGIRLWIESPYLRHKFRLLAGVARANSARAVLSGPGFATLVGDPRDLRAVELLFTSLLVQASVALDVLGQGEGPGGHTRSRGYRASFYDGFAARVEDRLDAAVRIVADETSAVRGVDVLPALRSRDEMAERHLRHLFPQLRSARARTIADVAGYVAGVAAADRASLSAAKADLPRAG